MAPNSRLGTITRSHGQDAPAATPAPAASFPQRGEGGAGSAGLEGGQAEPALPGQDGGLRQSFPGARAQATLCILTEKQGRVG